jgi:hypothetical protein
LQKYTFFYLIKPILFFYLLCVMRLLHECFK